LQTQKFSQELKRRSRLSVAISHKSKEIQSFGVYHFIETSRLCNVLKNKFLIRSRFAGLIYGSLKAGCVIDASAAN